MDDFVEFPKIYRLSRRCIITEKIDGANAQVCITKDGGLLVGSKTRWITPDDDNHGFARWAYSNKDELMKLGVGRHYGEWWGKGIQRAYNLNEKRFSLFNVSRWCLFGENPKRIECKDPRVEKYQEVLPKCCGLVPIMYDGIFNSSIVEDCIKLLKEKGSLAAPGFMRPEGVVCYHVQGNFGLKKTVEKDEEHKSNYIKKE